MHSAPPRSCTCSTRGAVGRLTEPRLSQAVAGRPLLCESGDHVTLSRRCSVWAPSATQACLSKVVALRTASSSYLLHQGCSRTGPRQLAPPQAVAGGPLMREIGDHVTLSRRCSVWAPSPALACLLKLAALSTASSSQPLHQGHCRMSPATLPVLAVAGRPLMCESGDRVTLSRRCSVWAPSEVLACLLKVVALSTASSSYLLHQGCPRTDHG